MGGALGRLCAFTAGAWPGRGLARLRGRTPAPWRSTLGSLGTAMGTGPGTVAAAPRPAVGGGRGRRRPHRATSQTRETLKHVVSFRSPPLRSSHSGSVKRGRSRVPGDGAVPDQPLPSVPGLRYLLSSFLLTKRDTLVESIPARGGGGGGCRTEIPTRGFPEVALANGGGVWVSLLRTSRILPLRLLLVFPSWGGLKKREEGGVWSDVLIVGDGGATPSCFNNSTSKLTLPQR